MEKLGARREHVVAVLGPTISQTNYEVGPDFPKAFHAIDEAHARYFIPSVNSGHHMFDLAQFLVDGLTASGIGTAVNLALCTYAEPSWFYSYRRATHAGEKDYGRLMSAIALRG